MEEELEAYNSAKQRDDNRNIMISIMHLGNIAHHEGELEEATQKFKKAEQLALKYNLNEYLASIYEHLASIYLTLNIIKEFTAYYSKALEEINKVQKPREIARFFNNSLVFFQDLQDPELEYQLLCENLKYSRKYNLIGSEISILINLSIFMERNERFRDAEDFLNQALELSDKYKLVRDKANILRRFGIISRKVKDYPKSNEFLKFSLKLAKKANDIFLIIGNYLSLGHLNKELKNFNESYRNFTQALNYYRELTNRLKSKDIKISFKKTYEDLPNLIKEINIILESGEISPGVEELIDIHEKSTNACKQGTELLDDKFVKEECIKENKRLKDLINLLKGPRLERDARELLHRRDHYEIKSSGRNWSLETHEIDLLYNYNCLKDKNTKTIEIDIYGKKNRDGKRYYILGECKNRKKSITFSEIKCFILKVNIIANHLLESYKKKNQKEPIFHLIIFSLEGFPDIIKVNELIEENLDLKKGRLLNRAAELIFYKDFISSLKRNKISVSIYKKLKELIIEQNNLK